MPDQITPATAQPIARDVLRAVGITVEPTQRVTLTDGDPGPALFMRLVEPSQLAYACDQFRQTTGESVDAEQLEAALPWA